MTDETRMTCLTMALEIARQTPGTDVVATAGQLLNFLTGSTMTAPKDQYHEAIEEVAARHNVTTEEILGDCRLAHICAARWEAVRAVQTKNPGLSTVALGKIFNRDHTTIMYALKKTAKPIRVVASNGRVERA